MTDQLLAIYPDRIGEWSLMPSSGGRFEFTVNGKLAFSKKSEGRFPEIEELRAKIDAA